MVLFWICVWLWGCVFKRRRRAQKTSVNVAPTTDSVQLKYLELLDQEIEHYRSEAEKLAQEEHELDNKIWWYEKHGLSVKVLKEQQDKIQQRLWSVQHKLNKAELNKERKLQNNG